MSEKNHNEEAGRKNEFTQLFMRRDRPLPKQGCSWAFYIFLVLLALGVGTMYIIYKTNS